MISDYDRDMVRLHDRRRTGQFVGGQSWATYNGVTVRERFRDDVAVPTVEAGMTLAFRDPDAGMHTGQCEAVRESWYVGPVKEVWDKDTDGDGKIHVSFDGGPRVPIEDVQPVPDHLSSEENGWIEYHAGADGVYANVHTCGRCESEGQHINHGQSVVR